MTRSDLLALRQSMYTASRAFNQTQQTYWVGTPGVEAFQANEAAAARLATALTALLGYLADDPHHAAERHAWNACRSGPILDLDRVEQLAPDLSSWATCLDSNRLGWT